MTPTLPSAGLPSGAGRDMILGFGTNQRPQDVRVFLQSARDTHPEDRCLVALICDSTDGLEDILAQARAVAFQTQGTWRPDTSKQSKAVNRIFLHGLRLVTRFARNGSLPEIALGYHAALETWHHPQLARWFAYERILGFMRGVQRVCLADVKDVVFQRPCFDPDLTGVIATEDQESFARGTYNGEWYHSAFGARAWQEVQHRMPVNIGVLIGEAPAMRMLVSRFAERIARAPFGKIEQAIFNKMVHEGAFEDLLAIVPNRDGIVAHLAAGITEADVICIGDQIADQRTGRVWPIVHMYDRLPVSQQAVTDRYAA